MTDRAQHPTRDLKFCLFCGQKPSNKTNEHVIPQWLIELTGDPKRKARFAPYWDKESGEVGPLELPWSEFKFPACSECNQEFGALESKASAIVLTLLKGGALSSQDLSNLLTWLDKIRIGIWLAIYYLHRKLSDIEPHMFINSRLDKTDRLVFIYRSDYDRKRLNLAGTDTLAFQYMPCCFTLLINNFALFNLAADFLISKRVGFPYPSDLWWEEWPKVAFALEPGRERMRYPLIPLRFNTRCTQVYQPMYSREELMEVYSDFYQTSYVNDHSFDPSRGYGKVLTADGSNIVAYPNRKSRMYFPAHRWPFPDLEAQITKQTLEYQVHLMDLGPKHKGLDGERSQISKRQHQFARKVNYERLQAMGLR